MLDFRPYMTAALSLLLLSGGAASEHPLAPPPLGGANAPAIAPPPALVLELAEIQLGAASIRVPTGSYQAPAGGAALYSVPGPIVSFRGADGAWRGHSYLETYPRLLSFEGTVDGNSAALDYRFEGSARYQVTITADTDGTTEQQVLRLHEVSQLGPRNLWVFDAGYGWQASAAMVTDQQGANVAFRYLPGHYDKTEATVRPAKLLAELSQPTSAQTPSTDTVATEPAPTPKPQPAGIALIDARPEVTDMLACWPHQITHWVNPDQMGHQLWQRRQQASDPASRHFLGPETKSDGTPNPRTAELLGPSLWEPHVTLEFALGRGERMMSFAILQQPAESQDLPTEFKTLVAADAPTIEQATETEKEAK